MAIKDNPRFYELIVVTELVDVKSDTKPPEVFAYAFSADGRMLTSAPVKDGGKAALRVPVTASKDRLRILVGPASEEKDAGYDDLIRRGAQQQFLLVDPRAPVKELRFRVFPDIWHCWFFRACFVRGKLMKRITVGGTAVEYPVCNATVEVFEVDPLHILIPKLPDSIIDKLRDVIVRPRPWPSVVDLPRVPEPFPWPGPGPDPAPFERRMMMAASGSMQEAIPPEDTADAFDEIANATELKYIAKAGSRLQFQQALIDHAFIIRPLLCRFFPLLVTKQKVATTTTDACGKFQTVFFRSCNDTDIPDLYFKARQRLFGFLDVTIYEPKPVSCHTHWDYVCGTEVTLYTKHPLAQICSPCPPVIGPANWVAFLAIGAHALSHIYGTAPALQGSTDDSNRGLTDSGAPWGGLLRPRLEFSNALEALGVKYYRISWRKGDSGDFAPLSSAVYHYYRHDVNTPTGPMPAWTPYLLGPKNADDGAGHMVPDLFEIPYPSVAPEGVWDAPPHISEIVEHFSNAKFPTQELAAGMTYDGNGNTVGTDNSGKYQLKLDLFNATGQPVNIAASGIQYVVPDVPDLTGTIYTTAATPLGLVSGNSMIVTLHVDNNHCFAGIDAPTIGALAADPCCGVLNYAAKDSVTMTWQAKHPHGFAKYHFGVVRGANSVLQLPTPGGWDPVDTGSFSTSRAVSNLLNDNLPPGCAIDGCPVAGFSENLYVDAMATDGWTNELGYDASAVRAFVLSRAAV